MKNCIELEMSRSSSASDGVLYEVEWEVADHGYKTLASGIIPGANVSQNSEQSYHEFSTKKCFDDDLQCAMLAFQRHRIPSQESGALRVYWNGVVWIDELYFLDEFESHHPYGLWLGEDCNRVADGPMCGYNSDARLLDIEFVTNANMTDVNWRVYSKIKGDFANVLVAPPWAHKSNTHYRRLHCLDRSFAGEHGCTRLGIPTTIYDSFITNITIRLDGEERTQRWECQEGLCDGDIVTPLFNCSNKLSNGAIAGIFLACLLCVMVALACLISHNSCCGKRVRGNTKTKNRAN